MDLSTEILIMLFLLMLSIMGGHLLRKRRHKYLQESGLTTLIGVAAGFILKSMDIEEYSKQCRIPTAADEYGSKQVSNKALSPTCSP